MRVISRSSGDRTLLQLPSYFPQHSSIVDMVVSGNRLAGVTSDGGFVVWELPTIIEDDVSYVVLTIKPAMDSYLVVEHGFLYVSSQLKDRIKASSQLNGTLNNLILSPLLAKAESI